MKDQINKGNKFTHYGGVDLNKQKTGGKDGAAGKTNQKPTNRAPQGNNQNQKPAGNNQNRNTANNNQQARGNNQGGGTANQQPATPAPPAKPTATNVPNGFSQNDIKLMANAVHGESRGEPYIGQVAVAAVILNRLESPSFPHTIAGVIFEPGAFTAVADGQIWLTPNETSKKQFLMRLTVGILPVVQFITLTQIQLQTSGFGQGHKLNKLENIYSVNKG